MGFNSAFKGLSFMDYRLQRCRPYSQALGGSAVFLELWQRCITNVSNMVVRWLELLFFIPKVMDFFSASCKCRGSTLYYSKSPFFQTFFFQLILHDSFNHSTYHYLELLQASPKKPKNKTIRSTQ